MTSSVVPAAGRARHPETLLLSVPAAVTSPVTPLCTGHCSRISAIGDVTNLDQAPPL